MLLPARSNLKWMSRSPIQAYYLGLPIYTGDVPIGPPPPAPGTGDFLQLPTATGTTTTSDGNFASDASSVAAGRHILLPSGTYDGRTLTFTNGTEEQPIIVRPQTPSSPPVLRGTWLLNGRVQFWGVRWDNSAESRVGSRLIRFETVNSGCGLYYCDVIPGGIGIELRGTSALNVVVYRSFFNGNNQIGVSGGNGYEAIKAGTNATFNTNLNFQCLLSKFRNFNKEREAIKMASRNSFFFKCQGINNSDISFRSCTACTLEECDWGTSRVTINGPDHRVDNCSAGRLIVCRGTVDGDDTVSGGGVYRAGKRVILRNNISNTVEVGVNLFSNTTWPEQADDTMVRNNSVSPTSPTGATWTTASEYPVASPVQINDGDVGVAGYQSRVEIP